MVKKQLFHAVVFWYFNLRIIRTLQQNPKKNNIDNGRIRYIEIIHAWNKHIDYYSWFVVFKALNRSAFSEFNFEKYELLIYGFGLDSGEGEICLNELLISHDSGDASIQLDARGRETVCRLEEVPSYDGMHSFIKGNGD